jgi:hypothetical protein
MVIVEELPAVTELGLKDADAPVGRPDAVSATDCALPEVTAVETVEVAEDPAATVPEVGESVREKSFVAVEPQLGRVNEAMRVDQLKLPVDGSYSLVYQKVQPSDGSICIEV